MNTKNTNKATSAAGLESASSLGWWSVLKTFASVAALAACVTVSGGALAQAFPSKPIMLTHGFGPGGAADIIGRALGAELQADLNQPVVMDSRPGAGQLIAASFVSRAKPDGYSLWLQSYPNLIAPSVLKGLPFKGNTDFAPVAAIVSQGGLLLTSAKFPANNLAEFISVVTANPAKYSYGSSGVGTATHVWLELMHQQIGARPVHVPFKSYPDTVNSLLSGDIDYAFLLFSAMQYVTAGKLKLLGSSMSARDPQYPDISTLDERGLKGFSPSFVFVVVAPKGTPPEIVQRLNAAITAATARESFASKVRALGGIHVFPPMSPAQTAELMHREDVKYDRLVREKVITFE